MGTSGNRSGFKIYSINTTIRNPKRNTEFLELFKPYDGKPFDSVAKKQFLFDCVKNGVYRFTNINQSIKNKLDNDIPLTAQEVNQAFADNPQATGFSNRTVTQLRSLKEQGFLAFIQNGRGKGGAIYKITNLGKLLLDRNNLSNDIYTIAMLALHGKSPIRETMYNESRPFLNTLFVISEVNRLWSSRNREAKGIKLYEFGAFVLSMKDCDFRKTAQDIVEYRNRFGMRENKKYIEKYIYNKQGVLPVKYESLMNDYVDDVFRKFEMTGLISKRGVFQNTYIDLSKENYGKVKKILEEFANYSWHNFNSVDEYYKFIDSIKLPWQIDKDARKQVIYERAEALNVIVAMNDDLDKIEEKLNIIASRNAIEKQLTKYSMNNILRELLIISKDIDAMPMKQLANLSEPLRLEFLLALMFGKKYGPENVTSNLIYNEEGEPLSFAPSGKSDIVFQSDDLNIIIEATTIKSRDQQLNSETSNLSRHLMKEENKKGIKFYMTLVAPYIHHDTCDYFQIASISRKTSICPLTISRIVEMVQLSDNTADFKNNFDISVQTLIDNNTISIDEFLQYINAKYYAFKENKEIYRGLLKTIYAEMQNKKIIDIRECN